MVGKNRGFQKAALKEILKKQNQRSVSLCLQTPAPIGHSRRDYAIPLQLNNHGVVFLDFLLFTGKG